MYAVSRRFPYGTVVLLLCMVIGCICFAGSVRGEVYAALERCLTVIIPSLYAMMIVSLLLTETGIWRFLARPLRRWTLPIFGLPDGCFALLLLSQIAGYPVGAGMLRALTEQGTLSEKDSRRLSCVCYGSGPAFLLVLLGSCTGQLSLFSLLFSSNVLANLILTVVLFRRKPIIYRDDKRTKLLPLTGEMLFNATAEAGKTLLRLCGIILCFAAGIGLLRGVGCFQWVDFLCSKAGLSSSGSIVLESLLEVTNATSLAMPAAFRLPLLAGLLSFGGICVLMQVCIAGGSAVAMRFLFPARLAAALLSALLCFLGMRLFPELKTAAEPVMASAAAVEIQPAGVFPSVMLVIMMLFVFREMGKRER